MKKSICLLVGIAVCALAFGPREASAASPQAKIPTVKITLYPAAEPVPALKYQLLPPMIERRPGNAAVLYGKVTAEQNPFFTNQKMWEHIIEWLEVPFDKFPKEQVPKEFSPPLYFLKMASRCESSEWDLPIREEVFYSILLPDAQQTRNFGRILALQARLHIACREYDKAIEMLQMGCALGRHVAEQPTLVSGLVGITIHGLMFARVLEWVQQPDSPNLYWALSALPRPMIDFRKALEAEMYSVYLSFPELRDLDKKDYPPAYWQYLLNKSAGEFFKLLGAASSPEGAKLATTALILEGYPRAKQGLIQRGHKAADVERMPVAQVVLLYTVRTYDEIRDDMFKWIFLPYPEARKGLQRAEESLRDAKSRGREIFPLASSLLPAVSRIKDVEIRMERSVAVLRVLSALRLHAVRHDRLPVSLKDVTEVPIPGDPVRGEPFAYEAGDASSAVLTLGWPGAWGDYNGARFEIELKKALEPLPPRYRRSSDHASQRTNFP